MPAPTYREVTLEDPKYPQGDWYEDFKGTLNYRAKRLLCCAWTDRRALIDWLYSEAGAAYPHDDGVTAAIVRRVRPLPRGATVGSSATLIAWSECLLEVFYDTDSSGPRWVNNQYVKETFYPLQWTHAPTGDGIQWLDGPITAGDRRGVILNLWAHNASYGRLATPPASCTSLIGCCNSTPKSALLYSYSFPAETVLFVPPYQSASFAYAGGYNYEIIYHHIINPLNWNKFWRASTGKWERAYLPDGETQYVQYPVLWGG